MRNFWNMPDKKVCILTSVHQPFDTRIFHKEAKALVKAGYDITLIAQHNKDEVLDGVKIIALPRPRNRFYRILMTCRIFGLAFKQKVNVYHFHDPELLPIGALLKLTTKRRIVYDVHENIPGDISTKPWLPKPARRPISLIYKLTEKTTFPFIDKIIIAEDSYAKNYEVRDKILVLRNYPQIPPDKGTKNIKHLQQILVYVGGISATRGIFELIESVRLLKNKNIVLKLVGPIQPVRLEVRIRKALEEFGLQKNISLVGSVKHDKIYSILRRCNVGLAILHPEPNYIESLPTKLFEYMAAGLPVIASNFPLWKEIVEGNNCGLTVNPLDPKEIARAIEFLMEHPDKARKMGENGRKAVLEKYNWENESEKLISLYGSFVKA
jgi:glycosyltransferase involved in cell wall biosynthesis